MVPVDRGDLRGKAAIIARGIGYADRTLARLTSVGLDRSGTRHAAVQCTMRGEREERQSSAGIERWRAGDWIGLDASDASQENSIGHRGTEAARARAISDNRAIGTHVSSTNLLHARVRFHLFSFTFACLFRWVASEWLPDIGLPQYAEAFLHSLVDARMLDTLSKKELEKFLNVTRKFHQASIVHGRQCHYKSITTQITHHFDFSGIHVLRILKYDRQSLAMRRMHCENSDSDPIVWTNQRFIRWACSIDLGEYAENLKGL